MQHVVAPDLTSPRFKANPYPFYARLRAEAPVYRTRLAGRGTAWLVTRYGDVVDLLRDERFAKDWREGSVQCCAPEARWVTQQGVGGPMGSGLPPTARAKRA